MRPAKELPNPAKTWRRPGRCSKSWRGKPSARSTPKDRSPRPRKRGTWHSNPTLKRDQALGCWPSPRSFPQPLPDRRWNLSMSRSTTYALCLSFSLQLASAAQPVSPPAGILYEPDIVVGKGGDVELMLDLARPEKVDSDPLPCVVMIHGGGWRGGDRKGHVPHIFEFARQGYVSATIQYRLVPKARFPAQIEDAKCAVRYLRANRRRFGLNPDRIGAIGFSAGGHLAMMLGTMDKADGLEGTGGHADQSSKVQAVVSYFGPTDLAANDFPALVGGIVNDFLGSTPEENPTIRKQASPIAYLDKYDAPLLIFHGTKDRIVPHTQAYRMADAMTKAGLPGRVELLIGADHGWSGGELARTVNETVAFFDDHLKAN
ncbi:MAG: alpha/beta hydrolase [Pirellulaceae bacterium]|nr:alpha/beta hydrolase [Pirellulaceae bacterium]